MVIPRRQVRRLVSLSLSRVVDEIDRYMKPYVENRYKPLNVQRPDIGMLSRCNSYISKLLIEELIKRREIKLDHFRVILSENVTELSCNENSEYSPFSLDILELISIRCKKFSIIHYHRHMEDQPLTSFLDDILHKSIERMSTNVTEINLSDSTVSEKAMCAIAFNCKSLRYLNLHKAEILFGGLEYLCHPESVVKSTLSRLIVDGTTISPQCEFNLLLNLKELSFFRSNSIIEISIFLVKCQSEQNHSIFNTFSTSVLKQNFQKTLYVPPNENVAEKIAQMFPNVNHVIMTSIPQENFQFINTIISIMNITKLELSNYGGTQTYTFSELKCAFNFSNYIKLTSLTLECFDNVDILYLGENCKNLDILILINNRYDEDQTIQWELFPTLKRVELLIGDGQLKRGCGNFYLNSNSFLSLMSSKLLEKIVVLGQPNLDIMFNTLLNFGYLGNLRELSFFSCSVRSSLLKIFHKGIPIEVIEFMTDDCIVLSIIKRLLEMIRSNNYVTLIIPMKDIPYRLRWSFVNLPFHEKKVCKTLLC